MSVTTLNTWANCAASFLLLLAFLLLSGLSVGLFMALRGLQTARRELPWRLQLLDIYLRDAGEATQTTAHAVVDPQVRVFSTWIGLKAAARVLLGRADAGRSPSSPDTTHDSFGTERIDSL